MKIHIIGSHSRSMKKERLTTTIEDLHRGHRVAMIMTGEDHHHKAMITTEGGHHKVMNMIGGDRLLDMTTIEEVLHLPTTSTIDVVLLPNTIEMILATVTHIMGTSIIYQHLLE